MNNSTCIAKVKLFFFFQKFSDESLTIVCVLFQTSTNATNWTISAAKDSFAKTLSGLSSASVAMATNLRTTEPDVLMWMSVS